MHKVLIFCIFITLAASFEFCFFTGTNCVGSIFCLAPISDAQCYNIQIRGLYNGFVYRLGKSFLALSGGEECLYYYSDEDCTGDITAMDFYDLGCCYNTVKYYLPEFGLSFNSFCFAFDVESNNTSHSKEYFRNRNQKYLNNTSESISG